MTGAFGLDLCRADLAKQCEALIARHRAESLEVGAVLLDGSSQMDCPGGLDVREFMVQARVTFPEPGAYVLEASAGGEVLIERALFLHPGRLHVAAGAG